MAIRYLVSFKTENGFKIVFINPLVLLQLQIGTIPIPKSVTKSRIEENINVFDFELNSDEIKILEQQDCGNRIARWPFINPSEKYYPFNAEF